MLKFLSALKVNEYLTLFTQANAAVPETVMHVWRHDPEEAAFVTEYTPTPEVPLYTLNQRSLVVPSIPITTFSLALLRPKSKILLKSREIVLETKYQEQTDISLGRIRSGTSKNCEFSWRIWAAYDVLPKGPTAVDVGGLADAIRDPVLPVTSTRNWPGLNV